MGFILVTGRGHTTIGDNYMIHQYDMNGVYITSYPQNVSSANLAGWGGRDMEADEAANTLYVGNDNGYVEIMTYDPVTGGISYASTLWSSVTGTVRGLCENQNTGNFFTKSFSSDIFEFDMTTGAVINSFANTAISCYGLGWDSSSNAIWSSSTATSAVEFDPATGLETGRTFSTALAGSQGGADVYNDSRNANGLSIVMLHQTAPDSIAVYDTVSAPPVPTLSVTGLVAGGTAKIDITNCTAGDIAYFVWSAAGGGPVSTPFGTGYVSPPYRVIPLQVDANGHAGMTQNVPPGLTGMALWFHGADKASATLTNPLAMTIG